MLKNDKAAGNDGVIGEILKYRSDLLLNCVIYLIISVKSTSLSISKMLLVGKVLQKLQGGYFLLTVCEVAW